VVKGLLDCTFARWSPGIGDPNIMGWVTVLVYAWAALVCLRAARGAVGDDPLDRKERLFWTVTAVVMTLYAVNKQLDLQSLATSVGRCIAKADGWYEQRRRFQFEFIIGLVFCTFIALVAVFRWLRGTLARTGVAAFGLIFVSGFVVIRAVGFHHVDAIINTSISGWRANWLLEIPGPLLVIVGAASSRIRPRTDPRKPS
jgi:hypothetical protein